jgi:hypothetical protein
VWRAPLTLRRLPLAKGPTSLRTRLQVAPPCHFNGIGHQFVLALGRLSFTEPPDVSAQDHAWLKQLANPARDVMDLVMGGPESENVWSLFQEEDGRNEMQSGGGGNVGGLSTAYGARR